MAQLAGLGRLFLFAPSMALLETAPGGFFIGADLHGFVLTIQKQFSAQSGHFMNVMYGGAALARTYRRDLSVGTVSEARWVSNAYITYLIVYISFKQ
jgi:hypothetical protein